DEAAHLRQLQWRRRHVALTDDGDQGFAGEPGRAAVGMFPGLRRHDAAVFARQVDAGAAAEAEQRAIMMHGGDAHLDGLLVELYVTGAENRLAHVDPAVAARSEEHTSELQSRFDLVR